MIFQSNIVSSKHVKEVELLLTYRVFGQNALDTFVNTIFQYNEKKKP